MNLPRVLLPAALALIAGFTARADVLTDPQPPLVFAVRPDATLGTAWLGVEDRTYFMEWSVDLVHWQYLPMMKHGTGTQTYDLPAQTEPTFFLRLHYTDQPTTDPAGADFDADGLTNWTEVTVSFTDPFRADSDGDGIPDGWERTHNLDPNNPADATADPDQDGLTNSNEWFKRTDPANPDTDADGLTDGAEVNIWKTNPTSDDTDLDGLTDGEETTSHHTDPIEWDTDGDLLSDGVEIFETLTNPLTDDTDGDWIDDGFECSALLEYGTALDPFDPADGALDPDGDTLSTTLEYLFIPEGFRPFTADTPASFPWATDPDNDNRTTLQEWSASPKTHPKLADTDGDGMPDGWEVEHQLDPASSSGDNGSLVDPDGDGLTNFDEWLNGTDPHNANSDGEGGNDGAEVDAGSDPTASPPANQSTPAQFENIVFTVSDPSDSESERWKMTITGKGPDDFRVMSLAAPSFGDTATRSVKLRKWNRYEITMIHLGTSPAYLRISPGTPDYDWRATADDLPSAAKPPYSDSPPFLTLRRHWLVDNRQHLLTDYTEGSTENLTENIQALLVPVEVRDNLTASGVDEDSITVAPDARGYQPDFWIMAPCGGPDFSNDSHFKMLLSPDASLGVTCDETTPTPATINLDNTLHALNWDYPKINWRGTGAESRDLVPVWTIGTQQTIVNLPVRVKTMKKRTVKITVFPVRDPQSSRAIVPLPDIAMVRAKLEETFGFQVNAWPAIDYKPQQEYDYDPDDDGYTVADSEAYAGMLTSSVFADPGADIRVLVIDQTQFRANADAVGENMNYEIYGLWNRPNPLVVINAGNPTEGVFSNQAFADALAHEIGHVMIGEGHPSDYNIEQAFPNGQGGPAPLPGTDTTRRLMSSLDARVPGAKLLVRTEWEKIEEWLKAVPDKRWRDEHGITDPSVPTGNY